MKRKVTLTMKEIKRLYVVQQVEEGQMTGVQGAEVLGLSLRQMRRLMVKYRRRGAPGLGHGNRGRAPNNRIEDAVRAKIVELSEEEYQDYNDSHFTEELEERHEIKVSRPTVRRIRREHGLPSPRKRQAPKHRRRRGSDDLWPIVRVLCRPDREKTPQSLLSW